VSLSIAFIHFCTTYLKCQEKYSLAFAHPWCSADASQNVYKKHVAVTLRNVTRNVTWSREPLGSDLLSVIERRNRAKLRKRATAAEGGTHVYLNSKMKHEFTLLLSCWNRNPPPFLAILIPDEACRNRCLFSSLQAFKLTGS
jgi:hypothetical protein